MKRLLLPALWLTIAFAGTAAASNILWFTGHSGYDEGHSDFVSLMEGIGITVDVATTGPLPDLGNYYVVLICLPGFSDPSDYFSAEEKSRLGAWLVEPGHRVVVVGDWDGFYQGQDVMADLLSSLGNPFIFNPSGWDPGCGQCSGPMGDPNPLTDGINHICYAYTATFAPGTGIPLAYPEDPAAVGPYVVTNESDAPCVLGLGDSNIITDLCGYLSPGPTLPDGGDIDTTDFTKKFTNILCTPPPVPVREQSWGQIKAMYR